MQRYEQVENQARENLNSIDREIEVIKDAGLDGLAAAQAGPNGGRRIWLGQQSASAEIKKREDMKRHVWSDMYANMERLSEEYRTLKERIKRLKRE